MRNVKKPSMLSILAAIAVCGALAALAYERPWNRASEKTAQADIGWGASPSKAVAATNSATPAHPHARPKAAPSKVIGTIENVDAPNHRFILKLSGGKSEVFRIAKWSVVLKHRRNLAFSALKAGESVIVQRRSGSNAAVRVYVLGGDKS